MENYGIEVLAVVLGLVVATFGLILQRVRARATRLRELEQVRKRHESRIESFPRDSQERGDAARLAGTVNTVLSEALAGQARPTTLQQRLRLAGDANLVTRDDLHIIANDIKTVFQAEASRSFYSGFAQNLIFTALGILAGAWLQNHPLF